MRVSFPEGSSSPYKTFRKFIMHQYVYYSYEEWGRGYIGVRSCECLPEEDIKYMGSYKDRGFQPTGKIILAELGSREEAVRAEISLHNFFEVHLNPHFANQVKQTSEGYDRKGVAVSEDIRQKYREAYNRFREENPELYELRKQKVLEGIEKFREENPEKVKQQLIDRGKKGAAGLESKRRQDSDLDRRLRQAVSKSTRSRFTPDYQQMLINKARESTAKPIIVTYADGSTKEFKTLKECKLYLEVSHGCLHRKIKGLPTRKLKDITVAFKDK